MCSADTLTGLAPGLPDSLADGLLLLFSF